MNKSTLLTIPNLITYTRLILLILSIYSTLPYFILFYTTSSLLDILDGYVARYLNQQTILGSCLDMITDRLSTPIICYRIIFNDSTYIYNLFNNKPNLNHLDHLPNLNHLDHLPNIDQLTYLPFISLYTLIDLLSHFLHFNLSLLKSQNHKINTNRILQFYYNKTVLVCVCFGSELFFICLCLNLKMFYKFFYGFVIVKMFFNFVQGFEGLCGLSCVKKGGE